ncbi:MAG: helix-turn-helix domain-containing protein [Tagaea sp.]|nr:helix-turn-helix domain-containing protein [Tagaea sp.]
MAQDWHPADVAAALKKAGVTLDEIGPGIGLDRSVAHKALYLKPWPRVKAEIARLLGRRPQELWPSLFDRTGAARPRNRRRHSNSSNIARNVCRADGP